jgi:beta-glucuronidase
MRERIDLSGFWDGELVLNPEVDVAAPPVIRQPFFVPLAWNQQILAERWPRPDQELSGAVRPVQNQNFRDIARKWNEGTITYRRTLSFSADQLNRIRAGQARCFLVCEGSSYHTEISLNDQVIGMHDGAHLAFEFDLSSTLRSGDNDLVLRVDNLRRKWACPQEQFNWKNFGGLVRPLFLEWRPVLHIRECRIRPHREGTQWKVTLSLALSQATRLKGLATIVSGSMSRQATLDFNGADSLSLDIPFPDPLLWKPGQGGLSHCEMTLDPKDLTADRISKDFGFRSIRISGRNILINDEPFQFRGVAWHEQHPVFGNTLPPWQIRQDLDLMRHCGLNAIRGAHYPYAASFYETCDRFGMPTLAELPCWQMTSDHFTSPDFKTFCCHMAEEMVRQLDNHPSIVGWIIQNESKTFDEGAVDFYGAIAQTFKRCDPTRFTVSAEHPTPPQHIGGINAPSTSFDRPPPTCAVVDVVGVNIYAGWYSDKAQVLAEKLDRLIELIPNKPLLVTEFGAEGIPGHRSLTLEPWTEDYQAELLSRHVSAILDRPQMAGFFLWLFMDYECASIGILGINSKGLVDPWRRPKLAFNAIKALLASRPAQASP